MHIVFVVRIWKYWTTSSHQQWNATIFSFSSYLDVTPHQGYMTLGIKYYWAKTDHWQRRLAQIFESSNSSNDQMVEAGEKALVILYRGQRNWCPRHNEASVISGASNCQQKGYTAKYVTSYIHCSKVSGAVLKREFSQWWRVGLAICDSKMVGLPISTVNDTAPPPVQSLLKLVWCTCKYACGTLRCGCRRQYLECSAVCSECRGV